MPQNTVVTAMLGAAVGAVAGLLVLTVVSSSTPASLYTTTAVRPVAVTSLAPRGDVRSQNRLQYAAAPQDSSEYEGRVEAPETPAPQSFAVYGWALVAVTGALNAVLLWNSNRKVSLASTTGRREALLAGAAAVGLTAGPAFAAYGDKANVFGKAKDVEQVFTIQGEGWTGIMPGKYNGSRENEVPGQVGRWEDNFDAVNYGFVAVRPGPDDIKTLGDIDQVRASVVAPMLGKQAFEGTSISEGGFAPGRYSAAAVLDQSEKVKDGKTYYYYELLTRTADGNEGGRHQLFVVTASKGKLFIFKQQAGDKRWFKGLERPLRASIDAFTVA